jgi:hypothetical protein
MRRKVEYKYVTSRNIVFNHAFESKGGGTGTETVQPLHYQVISPYIQQNQEKIRRPGDGVSVRNKYIGV